MSIKNKQKNVYEELRPLYEDILKSSDDLINSLIKSINVLLTEKDIEKIKKETLEKNNKLKDELIKSKEYLENSMKKFSKKLIILGLTFVLIVFFFIGCTEQNPYNNFDKRLINTEFLGGKYNLSILYI